MSTEPAAQSRRRILARVGRLLWIWGPAVLYMGLIFALSSMPRPPEVITRFVPSDRAAHFVGYVVLGLLLSRALVPTGRISQAATTAGIGALYGLTDEWHQSFVPGRHCDVLDWVVDVLGVTVGMLAWVWHVRRQHRKRTEDEPGASQQRGHPKPAE